MTHNPWAYKVSDTTRQREVIENETLIAQYDARLRLPELPAAYSDGVVESYHIAAYFADFAAGMGCSGATLRALIEYVEADASPLWDGLPDPGKGWYAIGKAEVARIESAFGSHIYTLAKTKELRAHAVRRLRVACNALAQR